MIVGKITLAALLLFSIPAYSQEKKHPIDVAMEKAQDANPSTAGMNEAISEALKKWEVEVNKSLKHLKKVMSAEEGKALEASQKAWIAYRDAELKTQTEIYSRMQGTMWRPASSHAAMDLTRARALQLKHYEEVISER